MSNPEPAGLSSVEGLLLSRQLLRPLLSHDIHDYVLEGICKLVDGQHVLAVAPTSGGKSSYFYGYLHLIRALQALSTPCQLLKRKLPHNPVMVNVVPTKGLEEQQETSFRKVGLAALALNEDTLATARRKNRNLVEAVSAILLSPELLSSQPFDRLLQRRAFIFR